MNGVFAVPGRALQRAFEPAAGFRKIAFTGEGPPRQRATKSSQDAAAPRTSSEGLKGKRAAANADQQTSKRKPLGGAVPAAPVPYALGRAMGGQVGFARRKIVRHAGGDASLGTVSAADGFRYIRRHKGNTPGPSQGAYRGTVRRAVKKSEQFCGSARLPGRYAGRVVWHLSCSSAADHFLQITLVEMRMTPEPARREYNDVLQRVQENS